MASATWCAPSTLAKRAAEELQRLASLGLLLAAELQPPRREHATGLGRHLEGLRRRAFGRELEDARSVRVQPHLRDEPAVEPFDHALELEHEDGTERGQLVECDAFGCVARVEPALLFGEELLDRLLPADRLAHVVRAEHRLHR